jgi:hypothetical protein
MTHKARIALLPSIGWRQCAKPHIRMACDELCEFIIGNIAGVEYDAWLGIKSGMVYLQISPGIDLPFDDFVRTVRDGWPEKKVAPAARSLFGEDE